MRQITASRAKAIEGTSIGELSRLTGVNIETIRKGGQVRGLVTGFRVSWWRKDIPDLQAAYRELRRVKVGRMARLRGQVETAKPLEPGENPPTTQQRIDATVEWMRQTGASEPDIQAFIKEHAAA